MKKYLVLAISLFTVSNFLNAEVSKELLMIASDSDIQRIDIKVAIVDKEDLGKGSITINEDSLFLGRVENLKYNVPEVFDFSIAADKIYFLLEFVIIESSVSSGGEKTIKKTYLVDNKDVFQLDFPSSLLVKKKNVCGADSYSLHHIPHTESNLQEQ